MKKYFRFIETLYDEKRPVGNLGRGTHYSVFRSISWFDEKLLSGKEAKFHDFAVIWDEDHDDRVIGVVERMYIEGILSPVLFVGERKGMLAIIVSESFPNSKMEDFKAKVQEETDLTESDHWSTHVEKISSDEIGIIADSDEKVQLYLKNIISLWDIGIKSCVFKELSEATE